MQTENHVILAGKDPNVSCVSGIFHHLAMRRAASGRDERISIATGVEYWYDKQFAIRPDFFMRQNKGHRKFFTLAQV